MNMDRLASFEHPAAWLQSPMLGIVTDIKDPWSLGRVKVRLEALEGPMEQDSALWGRLVCGFAGSNRGAWWIPDVDDEVLVVFQNGDPRHPIVLGGLWNGNAKPPESMDGAGNNTLKVIRSRNGVKVTLDDQDGQEQLILETPGGQKVTLKDGPGSVEIQDANGNSVKLESSGITITASAKVTVNASTVNVSAGMVSVDAGMAKFSGMIKCEALITNAVISASYTPGAGNVW